MIVLSRDLSDRVLAARGVLESGELANMRTYRLPRETKVHLRLVGDGSSKTLCGKPLRGYLDRWAWQFVHRGSFASSLPAHVNCANCLRSPVAKLTAEASEVRLAGFRAVRRPIR